MIPTRCVLLAVLATAGIGSCSETPPTSPAPSSSSSTTTPPPAPLPDPAHDATPPTDAEDAAPSGTPPSARTDPRIELRVTAMDDADKAYTAEATATFRTGGWDIVTDSVEVSGGALLWRVTITRPAPDEIVTQAFQTRTIRHEGHDGPVRSAQLHARIVVRGETTATPSSLFATWP